MSSLIKLVSSLTLAVSNTFKRQCTLTLKHVIPPTYCLSSLHTTAQSCDLMEFFDKKENWGANEVKVGRSWKKEELRIKSNSDLHKLWFVLLKERNMLLTMEHEAKEQVKLFPNPERIDKVEESMANLEEVVRERNRAYFELETGETGERPGKLVTSPLGLKRFHRMSEHLIPIFMNTKWQKSHLAGVHRGAAVSKFLKLYREKLSVAKRREINRQRNHVMQLLKRFPHLDRTLLQERYPNVDIQHASMNKKTRGHHEHNIA